jgi:hypothetical protein
MVFGAVLETINSNNVRFDMDDTINPLEEILYSVNVRPSKDIPQTRTITRGGAIDTPSFVLREFTIDASITKDLFDRLEAVSTPTARGANQQLTFRMRAEAQQAGSDIILQYEGFVRNITLNSASDQLYNVTFITRADDSTVVIS